MRIHKIWVQQCLATRRIKRHFGMKNALDYLLGEKLVSFVEAAEQHQEFSQELPRFQAAVWDVFNPYELAVYLTTLPRSRRSQLRQLLYVNSAWRSR